MAFPVFVNKLRFVLAPAIGWAGAAATAAGLLGAWGTYTWLSQRLEAQNARVQIVQTEVTRVEKDIIEAAGVEAAMSQLLSRKRVADLLSHDRIWPVQLFNQLARLRPQGAYLVSASELGPQLQLVGYAASYPDVASMVQNLAESPYFEKPRLIEVRTEPAPKVATYPVRFGITVAIRGRPNSAVGVANSAAQSAPNSGDPK